MNWQRVVESKEEGLAPPLRTERMVKLRGHVAFAEREGRGRVKRIRKRRRVIGIGVC